MMSTNDLGVRELTNEMQAHHDLLENMIRVTLVSRFLLMSAGLFAGTLLACSSRGKPANTGGTVASEGGAGTGGEPSTGGASSGGNLATGGTVSTGGSGGASAGGTAIGGVPITGGVLSTGGDGRTGGTSNKGGSILDARMDVRVDPDAARTAGAGSGGASTGGVVATGGNADGCDMGVYDSTSPPKVLSLTGNLGIHDPAAMESNGTYYAFATGLGAKTSTNLTTWNAAAKPFNTPTWMTSAISGVADLWAPDISQFGGKFHLYYAGSTFGSNKSCIGHATRDSLATGSWSDQGSATICSNLTTTDNWNAIDPNVVLDSDGTPWLTLGSFWGGLKIIQLDSSGNRVGNTVTAIAARPSNGGALEAPFMVRRCGYYYLFMSWDKCCVGADSTYNIRVVRGTNVTGPFVDKAGTAAMQGGGTLIAQGDATWAGPGGQSVMVVGNKAYLVYHAYAKSNGTATLRIADLVWDASGWPMPVGP